MIAQPFIIERSAKPAPYKMTQMHLAVVFEFVDDVSNDTATAVCGDGCVKIDCAMRTVRAAKRNANGSFKGLRTSFAKWRRDADNLCFATITQVLASTEVFSTNGARCRVEQRYRSLEQLRFLKRDHVLTTPA
jgi:hypothetical protein